MLKAKKSFPWNYCFPSAEAIGNETIFLNLNFRQLKQTGMKEFH